MRINLARHNHAPAHLEAISRVGGTGTTSVGWGLEEGWGTPLDKDGRGYLRKSFLEYTRNVELKTSSGTIAFLYSAV